VGAADTEINHDTGNDKPREATMDLEIELISDADGLAAIGKPAAVEKFLRTTGLWAASRELDLKRLAHVLDATAALAQGASLMAAGSGRWVRLTEESARLVEEHGLMKSKEPGSSHLMIGEPGSLRSWLQAETGAGAFLTNPAVLSGMANIMTQVASRQSIEEITRYLAALDVKVDDVLRKVDSTVVAEMVGTGLAIERALSIRDAVGEVDDTLWSTVAHAHQTIGTTQHFALDQLDTAAKALESPKVSDLAVAAKEAEAQVEQWSGVLARCFQLHTMVDLLELDHRVGQPAEMLEAHRRAMLANRQQRRDLVSEHAEHLLSRMDDAVSTVNAKMVWSQRKSMQVVESANVLGPSVHELLDALAISSESRSWLPRQLGRTAGLGAGLIQRGKDAAPAAAATGVVVLSVLAVVQKTGTDDEATSA